MFYNDPYELGSEIWTGLLSDNSITNELDMKILRIVYKSNNHEIRASEIVSKLNYYTHHGPINSEISRFSKRVVKKTGVQPPLRKDGKPRWWHVPFLGYENGNSFPWIMRPDLVAAFDRISDQNDTSILHSDEISIDDYQQLNEGATNQVLVNRYERNKHARNMCIAHYGNLCAVCGFDFERTYGPIGKNKIHVHHLIPISKIQHQYNVNPVNDLRPICPNCHQIIHSKRDPFTIEEVKRMIGRR
jgi:5-methylcytosine-specific restriction protein A